jgi:EmrB/QacA subfamily drug resistance transporter
VSTQLYPRRWQALGVLSVCLLVVSMANTILNVALPTIREELDASSSALQWIVDGYLLVFAGLLLAAGSLGDRFGRKKALLTGLTIFATGSVLSATAESSGALIAARALTGLGAAAIMPATLSILTNIFPDHERPKAIGIWAGVAGLGVALGPSTGGFLVEHFSSGVIFLVNVPLALGCIAAGMWLLPESRDPASPKLDPVGAALSVAGLTALVWSLIEAPERGWTSPVILAGFGIAAAVTALFVAWESRSEHPMLDVSVFRNLRFSGASVAIGFVFFALMGVMYFLTTYLQTVLGYSAFEAGLRLLPAAVGLMSMSRVAVTLTERVGTKAVVAGGLGIVAAALVLLAGADASSGYELVWPSLLLMGAGMGLAMSPATEAIMGALPRAKAGVGSAMNDVVRELGGTLGIAVLGSVLTTSYGNGVEDATAGLPHGAAEAASDSVGAAHEVGAQMTGAAGETLVRLADSAFVDAMATTSILAAVAAGLGALVALVLLPARAAQPRLELEPAAA